MDVAYEFARHIVKTRYEDLPADAVEATKRSILDTLGVTVAASTLGQGCQEMVDLVKESAAKGKSTIVGYGGQVPSWLAGFANGTMTHQLDYDDMHDEDGLHPGACSVMAAFATAEEAGGINGKELITAVALAIDVTCRISRSVTARGEGGLGWHMPTLLGPYNAAVAAGRILGLSEEEMLSAFGHAHQMAAGNIQAMLSPGGIYRAMRDGFSIKNGILSALMAKRGLPGTKDSFESQAGLFNLYFRGMYDRSKLTEGLGETFEGSGVAYKPWPACRGTHAAIDATLRILREHDIPAENIEGIDVAVSGSLSLFEPVAARCRPQTIIDAKFSTPFALGIAATRRKITLMDYTFDGLRDAAVIRMAEKVTGKVDHTIKGTPWSTVVAIKTKNGGQYSKQVDFAYGHPKNPIAREDLVQKFKECVAYSAKPIAKGKIEKIIGMVSHLEEVEDAGAIVRMLG